MSVAGVIIHTLQAKMLENWLEEFEKVSVVGNSNFLSIYMPAGVG